MFLKLEVERLKNIEETTRRDYRNISERGAEIRRRPGRRDTESNAEIEDAIKLFDRSLLSVRGHSTGNKLFFAGVKTPISFKFF